MTLQPSLFPRRADNQPLHLYKFTEARFARSMLEHGRVRIGTLFDFRKVEEHRSTIGDAGEAEPNSLATFDSVTLEPGKASPPYLARAFAVRPDATGPTTTNGLIVEHHMRDEDYYVYCVTAEYSVSLLEEAGYDSCVRIEDPRGFFQAMTDAIEERVSQWSVQPCTYGTRTGPYNPAHERHPVWVKDPSFSAQCEIRAVWTPRSHPIEPFTVDIPELRQFLQVEAIPA
jgi:hypothetical protein